MGPPSRTCVPLPAAAYLYVRPAAFAASHSRRASGVDPGGPAIMYIPNGSFNARCSHASTL